MKISKFHHNKKLLPELVFYPSNRRSLKITSNAGRGHAKSFSRSIRKWSNETMFNAPSVIGQTLTKQYATNPNAPLFTRVLIANRGEIACRIIKTCRSLGIHTIAVHSSADAKSRFVDLADESYLLGPPEPSQSYLNYEHLLKIAKKTKAQAIHPGYGFLSENANFYRACSEAGVTFIGPKEYALTTMGDKQASKRIMEEAGVPVVPGYHDDDQSVATLQKEAEKIGYPVLVKAVMGGGGKGMRIVHEADQFVSLLKDARDEAKASFGDDRVILEKFISRPRHIEIQVFGDRDGNAVHLFERDCSVQRRMQKIIEEAPAPGLPEELRQAMGESAVAAAKAVDYEGAGTVEFIMDLDSGEYYFMEMNTRLQVEHPVTEMVTGVDLVEWQLRVASGQPLPVTQEGLKLNGHAFEARIYAERPIRDENGVSFLPGTGTLEYLKTPEENESVRVETGVRQGDEVSVYYDPMIAKLVVHGVNRDVALKKLKHCLDDYQIAGVPTNIEFIKTVAMHPTFVTGEVDCNFIPEHQEDLFKEREVPYGRILASLAVWAQDAETKGQDPFEQLRSVRVNHNGKKVLQFEDGNDVIITLSNLSQNAVSVTLSDGSVHEVKEIRLKDNSLVASVDSHLLKSNVYIGKNKVHLFTKEGSNIYELKQEEIGGNAGLSAGALVSPMPGQIVEVHVEVGQRVEQGDSLLVLLAMKMQNTIKAPKTGVIKRIVAVNDLVGSDEVLVEIEEE